MYSPREREQRRIVDQRCEKLGHGLGVLEREVDKCRRRLFYDLQASWEKEVQRQKNERWRRAVVVIIENYVRKWLVRRAYLKFLSVTTSIQEATKVAINPIQDSRANLLEEGGNDTVQPCDTTQVRSDSDFSVKRRYMNFVIYFHLTCGLPIWLGFFSYKMWQLVMGIS